MELTELGTWDDLVRAIQKFEFCDGDDGYLKKFKFGHDIIAVRIFKGSATPDVILVDNSECFDIISGLLSRVMFMGATLTVQKNHDLKYIWIRFPREHEKITKIALIIGGILCDSITVSTNLFDFFRYLVNRLTQQGIPAVTCEEVVTALNLLEDMIADEPEWLSEVGLGFLKDRCPVISINH
jgi:hypothetical protein